MKVYQTNKLYFKKWAYRIETSVPGASLVKRWGINEARKFCIDDNTGRYSRNYSEVAKKNLLDFIIKVEPFITGDLQIRAEWDTLSFYLNDINLYNNILDSLEKYVVSVSKPSGNTDLAALENGSKIILCNDYPHGKYRHRVYIRYRMPPWQRTSFLEWLKNYEGTIQASAGTIKWLGNGSPYFQDPFVYVADRSQLLLVTLFLGGHVRSIQDFVISDMQLTVK
jgi:hypothetical protein